jgi:hypothetical protein
MYNLKNKPVNWPFPVQGQIKRAMSESDRAKVEHKQAKADQKEADDASRKSLGDALF